MDTLVTPLLALLIIVGLAVSENVQLEIIKLFALTVTSVGSVLAAYLSYKERREGRRGRRELNEKIDRKRRAVRERGKDVVIVEERRKGAPRSGDADA